MKRILVILSVLILAILSCQVTSSELNPATLVPNEENSTNAPSQEIYLPPPESGSLTALYESALPGVVSIRVITDNGSGIGSGFLFDDQGHVVTNFHVVEGATEV